MTKRTHNPREVSEIVAVQALSFIAGDAERLGLFLAETGIGPETLRSAAADPHFSVTVIGCADSIECDPIMNQNQKMRLIWSDLLKSDPCLLHINHRDGSLATIGCDFETGFFNIAELSSCGLISFLPELEPVECDEMECGHPVIDTWSMAAPAETTLQCKTETLELLIGPSMFALSIAKCQISRIIVDNRVRFGLDERNRIVRIEITHITDNEMNQWLQWHVPQTALEE